MEVKDINALPPLALAGSHQVRTGRLEWQDCCIVGVGLADKGGVVDRGVACGSALTKLCKQIYLVRVFLLPTLMWSPLSSGLPVAGILPV